MTEKRNSMDALLEASSLRWQENTAAVHELDKRVNEKLESLIEQIGRLTENVNRVENQIMKVAASRPVTGREHCGDFVDERINRIDERLDKVASVAEQQAKAAQTLADVVQKLLDR